MNKEFFFKDCQKAIEKLNRNMSLSKEDCERINKDYGEAIYQQLKSDGCYEWSGIVLKSNKVSKEIENSRKYEIFAEDEASQNRGEEREKAKLDLAFNADKRAKKSLVVSIVAIIIGGLSLILSIVVLILRLTNNLL